MGDRRSHSFIGSVLDDPQDLLLYLDRDVSDLIKEQCPALCFLESSFPCLVGPGERTLFITEQLAFYECGCEGGAVDGHEVLLPAPGQIVQPAGRHLLSASALSDDKDTPVHSGGIGYAVLEIEENFGFTDVTVLVAAHVVNITTKW